MLNCLLDEHIPIAYRSTILALVVELDVLRVGDVGAPPLNASDPEILIWCDENASALITNNRKSMPRHLADHVAQGQHIPGIFVVDLDESIGRNAELIAIYLKVSLVNEFQDQIIYL
jgi:hypothetical protein